MDRRQLCDRLRPRAPAQIRPRLKGPKSAARRVDQHTVERSDATRRGGVTHLDLGWFAGDAYGSRVAEVIKGMKPGEISQPFQTDAGWHVMQLEDTRNTDKTNELQRDQAKSMVFQRKAEDEYESFLRQIRSEAYVEIRLPGAAAPAATPTTGVP